MRVLRTDKDVPWISEKNEIQYIHHTEMPPADLITSVHILAFQNEKVLFINHENRGWDIPGGHIEFGESVEGALRREVYEEAAAKISTLKVFAHIKVYRFDPQPSDAEYPYPESYIVFYVGLIDTLDPFGAEHETIERKLLSLPEALQTEWAQKYPELFDAAMGEIKNAKELASLRKWL